MTKQEKSWMLKGANDERTATLAHLRRLMKRPTQAQQFVAWLLLRNERYNKRAGGLGK